MAVSKRLRYEVLRRDNHACRYCGATAPDVKLTIDHVKPVTLGGSDEPSNLVTACADCNSGKTSSTPDSPIVADVEEKALLWAAALEVAAQQREVDDRQRKLRNEIFEEKWELHRPHYFRSCDLPNGWQHSLDQFARAGLSDRDIIEMVPTAMGSRAVDKWKYYCGCCWSLVRKSHEEARALIDSFQEGE